MRKTLSLFFILQLILAFSVSANATSFPRSVTSGNTGLIATGLGESCRAFDIGADVLPCNPAHLTKKRDPKFSANLSFGNHVNYIDEARKLVDGKADQAAIKKLFNDHRASDLQAQVEAGYSTSNFGLSVTPLRLNYYSLFRNSALPQITVFASREESAKMQVASVFEGLDGRLSWGAQLRYVHRQFIAQQFFVTDALAEDGEKLFSPQEQSLFYAEPTVMYFRDDLSYKPEVSLGLAHLGIGNYNHEKLSIPTEIHLSASLQPLGSHETYGVWSIGFDYGWSKNYRSALDPLTVASTYGIGILTVYGSLAENSSGAGFSITSGPFQLGLTSSGTNYENSDGEKEYHRRYDLMLGIQI